MSSLPNSVLIGQRYRLDRLLGEGWGGAVYAATDLLLGRRVAVKRMKSRGEDDVTRRADAFVSEARTLAGLRHPHIVEIHDVGRDEQGTPYFVMELMEQSLGELLAEQGILSTEQTLSLLLPLCGALAYAHEFGIVHCDLKPENIAVRVARGGILRGKLLDFGVARFGDEPAYSGTVVGTPGYLAPEQVRGEGATRRSDVWALGAVAFKCLGGRLPFDSATVEEQLARTASEPPLSLRVAAPHVPTAVALAIDRALEGAPRRRYGDTRLFARALVRAAVQSHLRVPSDPDPIGLPDLMSWGNGGPATTARIAPIVPAPQDGTQRGTRPLTVRGLLRGRLGRSAAVLAAFVLGLTGVRLARSVLVPAHDSATVRAAEVVQSGPSGTAAPRFLPLITQEPRRPKPLGHVLEARDANPSTTFRAASTRVESVPGPRARLSRAPAHVASSNPLGGVQPAGEPEPSAAVSEEPRSVVSELQRDWDW